MFLLQLIYINQNVVICSFEVKLAVPYVECISRSGFEDNIVYELNKTAYHYSYFATILLLLSLLWFEMNYAFRQEAVTKSSHKIMITLGFGRTTNHHIDVELQL